MYFWSNCTHYKSLSQTLACLAPWHSCEEIEILGLPKSPQHVSGRTMAWIWVPDPDTILCTIGGSNERNVSPAVWRHIVKCDRDFESTQISFWIISLWVILLRGMLYFSGLSLPHTAAGNRGEQQPIRIMSVSNQLHSIYYVANTKCSIYISLFNLTLTLWDRYYNGPHFTGVETEAQSNKEN